MRHAPFSQLVQVLIGWHEKRIDPRNPGEDDNRMRSHDIHDQVTAGFQQIVLNEDRRVIDLCQLADPQLPLTRVNRTGVANR